MCDVIYFLKSDDLGRFYFVSINRLVFLIGLESRDRVNPPKICKNLWLFYLISTLNHYSAKSADLCLKQSGKMSVIQGKRAIYIIPCVTIKKSLSRDNSEIFVALHHTL